MILVDAHVHIYDCFDLCIFLDGALDNFQSQTSGTPPENAQSVVLMLAEQGTTPCFDRLLNLAGKKSDFQKPRVDNWTFHFTDEQESLAAENGEGYRIYLVAGQQLITAEKLEVIALGTNRRFEEGIRAIDSIQQIFEADGIPVFPWGVGKWLGERGQLISRIIKSERSYPIFLGDNSGRPIFWKRPRQFKIAEAMSIPVLPGSDPLPFTSEQKRAGSFGFSVDRKVDPKKPAQTIKRIVSDKSKVISPYGSLEKLYRFCINQIRMQCRKRMQ